MRWLLARLSPSKGQPTSIESTDLRRHRLRCSTVRFRCAQTGTADAGYGSATPDCVGRKAARLC